MAIYLISGAGTTAINGTYAETGTYYAGAKVYKKVEEEWYLFRAGLPGEYNCGWDFSDYPPLLGDYYYQTISDSDTPPFTGWYEVNGILPAPTISEIITAAIPALSSGWIGKPRKKKKEIPVELSTEQKIQNKLDYKAHLLNPKIEWGNK